MDFLTSSEKVEKLFEKYFQKVLTLTVNDEQLKKGKFLLIKNCVVGNNFYYELTIEKSKKLDQIKIPYPFFYEEYEEDNLIYMDYRLKTLFKNYPDTLSVINGWKQTIDTKTVSRFFDNILEISFE
jgi:hypothetical protein